MTATRRWVVLIGAVVLAALIAFPLRGIIHDAVIMPASLILWYLGLFYHSMHQVIWWGILVFIVILMLVFSLVPESVPVRSARLKPNPPRGQVESLARGMWKSKNGIYFKWLVANRLGKLAYQILLLREHGKPRSVFAPLEGEEWNATADVQEYLDKGLHGSFAEFPNGNWRFFNTPVKTPLDCDVAEVIEFLESKVENQYSR